jgi:putative membrane protein
MLAVLGSHPVFAHPHPGGWGDHSGGPGWWLVFPILFWLVVLSGIGYLAYRRSPGRVARDSAERTLADRYARGEISEEELRQRRAVLRGKG